MNIKLITKVVLGLATIAGGACLAVNGAKEMLPAKETKELPENNPDIYVEDDESQDA